MGRTLRERIMKICVVGAGAIGGLMGAKMSLAGEDVTFIANVCGRPGYRSFI